MRLQEFEVGRRVFSTDDFLLRCLLSHFYLQFDSRRLDITIAFTIKRTDANKFSHVPDACWLQLSSDGIEPIKLSHECAVR